MYLSRKNGRLIKIELRIFKIDNNISYIFLNKQFLHALTIIINR